MVRQATQDKPDRTVAVRRDQEGRVTVSVPVRFYRRNGRQTIVAESSDTESTNSHPNAARIKAIAKAYLWQEQLESGEFAKIEELAKANNVDRTYVGRILRLTSLAPTVVGRILDGRDSLDLSIEALGSPIPEFWTQQPWG